MNPFTYLRVSRRTNLALLAVVYAAAIIGLLALAFPASAQDSRWLLINENEDGNRFYLDTESHLIEGSQAWIWSRFEKDGDETLVRSQVDCSKNRFRNLEMTVRYRNGRTDSTMGIDQSWRNPVPDSVFEFIVTNLCTGIRQRAESQF